MLYTYLVAIDELAAEIAVDLVRLRRWSQG